MSTAFDNVNAARQINFTRHGNADFADIASESVRKALAKIRTLKQEPILKERAFKQARPACR